LTAIVFYKKTKSDNSMIIHGKKLPGYNINNHLSLRHKGITVMHIDGNI